MSVVKLSEAQIQEQIVAALQAVGCTVYHTSTHGVRQGTGVSKGVPDLLVRHSTFPIGMFLGIEVKKPKGWKWSSYEQWRAWNDDHTALAFGPRTALAAVLYCGKGLPATDELRVRSAIQQLPFEEYDPPEGKLVPKPTGRAR